MNDPEEKTDPAETTFRQLLNGLLKPRGLAGLATGAFLACRSRVPESEATANSLRW